MADSVKEVIFQELAKLLETITSENGYLTDVKKVYLEERPIGEIEQFPAIVVEQGVEEYLTGQGARRTQGLLEKKLSVFLTCFLYSQETLQQDIRRLEQDIEKLIYGDKYTTQVGYSLNGSCFECHIIRSEPFGTITEKPNGGTRIELVVYSHQRDTDPTQQA